MFRRAEPSGHAVHGKVDVLDQWFTKFFFYHEPFVGPIPSPRITNCSRKTQIYQVSFDQKFEKPGLTQMRQKDNSCQK